MDYLRQVSAKESSQSFTKIARGRWKSDWCLLMSQFCLSSIFAVSVGAYMAASNPVFSSMTTPETWNALRNAREALGEECDCSPSLRAMRESLRETLSSLRDSG